MLVIEIALGVIMAVVALGAVRIIAGEIANFLSRPYRPLIPPFWRNPADKRRGPNPFWLTTIVIRTSFLLVVFTAILRT